MCQYEVFQNHYFILNKRLLMAIGVWPYQNASVKLFLRIFIIVSIYTMMIRQLIRAYEERFAENRRVRVLVENFVGFLYFLGILSKLVISPHGEKKLRHVYEEITKDFNEIREPGERFAMNKVWKIGRLLSVIYSSYMFFSLWVFVFTPQILPVMFDLVSPVNESRPKAICYYAEYFVDQQEHLLQLTLHTFVIVAMTLLIISAVDTSFVVVGYHVLGLFNFVMYRLKQMIREDENIHNFANETIKIHEKTLHISETVCITYNGMHFIATTLAIVASNMGTFGIIANIENTLDAARIAVVWFGLLACLFFINCSGDELLHSIYFCNWYKLPLKTQFLMKFMMMRCLIPCQPNAGPLLQMNLSTIISVLKLCLSYFTAMTSMG